MKKSVIFILLFYVFSVTPSFSETIKIAAIFADTGRAADVGRDFFKVVRLTVNEVNQQGGLLNRKIELLEFDNFSKPLSSREAAMKAVDAGVVAVIGASWSSNSKAMAEVLQKAKIPMITPLATNPDVTKVGDFIFRTCFIDPFQGKVMASFAHNDLKARTAAVFINADSSFSRSLAIEFSASFEQIGGKVVHKVEYLRDDNDYTEQIEQVAKMKPDVVYLSGYSRDSGFIIKQSHMKGMKTTFLGGDGWNLEMLKYSGEINEDNYFTNHWHQDVLNPVSQALVKRYADFSSKSRLALGYDATMVLLEAIQHAGNADPQKIRDAIAATENFNGATGHISFNVDGDPLKAAVILRFTKDNTEFIKTVIPN